MSSTVGKKQRRRPVLVEQLESRVLMARILGIDISSFQPTSIDWNNFKSGNGSTAPGYTYVYAKGTEGLSYQDAHFHGYASGASGAGVPIGAYDYARYDLGNDPVAEADYFVNFSYNLPGTTNPVNTKIKAGGLVPMLDVEAPWDAGDSSTYHTKAGVSAWVNDWCNEVKLKLGVSPVVYSYSSYAGSWLNSTVSQNWGLFMADYPSGHVAPLTDNPTVSMSPWQSGSWSAWQYTDGNHTTVNDGGYVYGLGGTGVTGSCDADVLNGDLNTLNDFTLKATGTGGYSGIVGRWGANSWVTMTSSQTAWATSAANTSGPTVASGTTGKVLAGPIYGNSYMRWQVDFGGGVVGWVGEPFMKTAALATPTAPTPANSTTIWLSSLPTNFAWTGANASSDKVYVDGVLKTTATTNAWAHTAIADGSHTWRVDPVNAELSGTGTTWNFKIDTTGPGAAYGNQAPGYGSSVMQFTVTYTDASSGVDYTSLNTGDISVTGPGGYSQTATFVSVDTASNGATRVATYSVPAPDGTWDHADDGLYTVSLAANQVKDAAGNYKAATTLSSFAVGLGFAYLDGSVLKITFGSPGPITLSVSGTTMTATQSTSSYSFTTSSFNQILLGMTSGADALVIAGAVGAPLIFAGDTGGADTITFNSGSSALVASDPSGAAVTVNSGAVMALSVPATFSTVTVNSGMVVLAAGRTNTLRFSNLVFSGTGSLNPSDNDLIWDYSGATPINTLRGYLLSGRNGGTWNGPGIDSSSDVESVSNGMGYAEATDLGVTTYDGQTVDTTTLLVKYTPVGDANLDGYVDSDDYVLIDRGMGAGIPAGAAHWTDGDFNYNGSIDAGDYLLIDATNAREASGVAFDAESLAIREAQFGDVYVETLLSQGTTPADTSVVTADEGTQADIVVIEPAVMEETVVSTPAPETAAASAAVVVQPLATVSNTTEESSKTHKPVKKTAHSIFEAVERKHHGKTA